MAVLQFHPQLDTTTPVIETLYPYIQAVIDAKDHKWIHQSWFKTWKHNIDCKTEEEDESWIGLWSSSGASVNFTKNIILPETGLYRIEIKMDRGPKETGNIKLYINDKQLGDTEKGILPWNLSHRVVYPTTRLEAGIHSFKVTLTKTARISDIKIYKIRRYTGGTDTEHVPSNRKLEISDGTFTQNSANEINTMNLNMAFKEDYYDPYNEMSGLCFDYTDSVTLYLGESVNDTKVMFGGYLTGLHLNFKDEENPKMTIDFQDRLLDMQREPLYNKFDIALASRTSTTITTKNATGTATATTNGGGIAEIMRKYNGYSWESCDCFCMSSLLYAAFKKAGIRCKIVYYPTNEAPEHRTVRIDVGNGWQDAPYREFGFDTLLRPTSSSKSAPTKTLDGILQYYPGIVATTTKTPTVDCVTGTMYNSCAYHPAGFYQKIKKSWLNRCPHCGGKLSNNPKHTYEGEWTCKSCGADYCGYCGREKLNPSPTRLTACSDITTTTTSTDGTTTQTIKLTPYTQFASVYRACRYIASVGEYDIKHYEVPYDYGFKQSFESLEEYNTVANSCVKYRPEWDTRFGNPRPSLKLTMGIKPGLAVCTLYQDDEGYDAATYPILNISYYSGGAGSKYSIPGNLIITMHRADETINEAQEYTINFTGATGGSNVLTGIKTVFNGKWQEITLKLDELFDKKASNSKYQVTKIEFKGTITSSNVKRRTISALWFDQIMSYKSLQIIPFNISADVRTPFENLQELMEKSNHAAYVRYGDERRDDILVVQPVGNTVLSEPATEGYNIQEVEKWDYTPKDDGLANQSHKIYNLTEKDGKETPHPSFAQDTKSKKIYGPFQSPYETIDAKTKTSADKITLTDILTNSFKYPAFTLKVKGCTLFEPSQYIATIVNSRRINGLHIPKAITHSFGITERYYYTSIDFNKPSKTFMHVINKLKKDMEHQGIKTANSIFMGQAISTLGSASTGAFTK